MSSKHYVYHPDHEPMLVNEEDFKQLTEKGGWHDSPAKFSKQPADESVSQLSSLLGSDGKSLIKDTKPTAEESIELIALKKELDAVKVELSNKNAELELIKSKLKELEAVKEPAAIASPNAEGFTATARKGNKK